LREVGAAGYVVAEGLAPGWVDPDAGHLAVALATAVFAPVFPCLPSKRPASPNGFKDATVEVDRIERWWSGHPDHLVGVPTEGLVVVDLDEDDPPTGATWAWWHATAEAHGWQVTDAPIVDTPSQGLHLYFACPVGVEVRNSAGKLAPGVDVRGAGGYVIAPGSTLPDGRQYELLQPFPAVLPVAPPWLVGMCAKRCEPPAPVPRSASDWRGSRYGLRALESECGRLAVAANGQRNHTLTKAAHALGRLVAGGELDAGHVAAELWTVAQRTGLGDREIEATLNSGLRAGARNPRSPR
jgi:hypothetical protein